jgi:DNA-binding transcriptional MerR regulator
MYTIHDLCKASKLSRSAILYYDSVGLLKPAKRSESNYRLYSDESLKTLKKICLYRETGMALKDISIMMDAMESDDSNISILESTLSQLNSCIRDLQEKRNRIINMIKTIKSGHEDVVSVAELDDLQRQVYLGITRTEND